MMEIMERHGLAIAVVAPEDVDAAPWRSADRHLDLVRVAEPPATAWPRLSGQGFVPKPAMLTWTARLGEDEETFLAGLDTKSRQDIRRAKRRAAESGLRLDIEDPPTGPAVDRFLTLYGARVAQMRHGIALAHRFRDAILESGQYFAVYAHDGDRLVGGAIVLGCPEVDAIRIRFSAVVEEWRRASLARVLYFAAMRVARDKGYAYATLGDEPNLYGHLTQPGLLAFKGNTGFQAVPSQDFGDPEGEDVADLILNLTVLNDPSIVLGYADPADSTDRTLSAHVFSTHDIEPKPYAAPFLAGITVRRPG
jgi:GNAT superfamily N-acetyltransferase